MSEVWLWIINAFIQGNFRKVGAEFFNEVAVLLFVFPILDYWVQHGIVVKWLLYSSFGAAAICLVAAGILSKRTKED